MTLSSELPTMVPRTIAHEYIHMSRVHARRMSSSDLEVGRSESQEGKRVSKTPGEADFIWHIGSCLDIRFTGARSEDTCLPVTEIEIPGTENVRIRSKDE